MWRLGLAAALLFPLVLGVPGCGGGSAAEAGRSLLDDGRPREAARVLESYVRKNPDDATTRILLGRALTDLLEYENAAVHLDRALELEPHDADAIEWRARAYREQARDLVDRSDLTGARQLLADAIRGFELRLDGTDADAHYLQWIGNLHLLRFETYRTEIEDLLTTGFEQGARGPILGRLFFYVQSDAKGEARAREQLLSFIRNANPTFGGTPAIAPLLAPARQAFAATKENLRKALKANPELTTAARAMASMHFDAGEWEDAKRVCERVLSIPVEGDEAERERRIEDQFQARLMLAELLRRDDRLEESLQRLQEAYRSEDVSEARQAELLMRMCPLQVELGKIDPRHYEDLRQTARRLLELSPQHPVARTHQAIVAFEADRDPQRAMVILSQLGNLQGRTQRRAVETLARSYIQLGRHDDAILCLLRALENDEDFETAHVLLAETYRERGYRDEALEKCVEILREDPTNTIVQEIVRKIWASEIHDAQANANSIVEAETILRRDQYNDDVRFELALMLARAGELAAACDEMLTIAERHEKNFYPLEMLGKFELLRGRTREARGYFLQVRRIAPGLPAGEVGLGRCSLREQNYREASARFEEALKIAPDDPEALLWMATCETRRGNAWRAVRYVEGHDKPRIESLARVAPESMLPELAALRAEITLDEYAWTREGPPKTTLIQIRQDLESVLESNPERRRPRVALARCLDASDIDYDARDLLFPGLSANAPLPVARELADEDAIVHYVKKLLQSGKVEAVFGILRRFDDEPRTPLHARLVTQLARAQFRAGNLKAAQALASTALRELPHSAEVNRVLADLQLRQRNPAVMRTLNRIVAAEPGNLDAYRAQADIASRGGRSTSAMKAYQRLLKLLPEDLEVAQRAADLFERRNRGGATNPKLLAYARSSLQSKRPTSFASRLVALRFLSGLTGARAAEELRVRALTFYAMERFAREIGPLTRLRLDSSVHAGRTPAPRESAQDAPPPIVRPILNRDERRILAAFLLARDAAAEAFWTITRFDPGEGTDEDFEPLDRQIILTCLAELGRADEARAVLDDTLRLNPDDPAMVEAFFPMALLVRDYDAAREWITGHAEAEERESLRHLVRILEDRPAVEPLPSVLMLRIQLFRQFPLTWVDAVRDAKTLTELLPSSPVPYLIWAQELQRRGETELAVRTLTESIERTPRHVPTILTAVNILAERRDKKSLTEATRLLDTGLEFNPDSAELIVARTDLQLHAARKSQNRQMILRGYKRALAALEAEGRSRSTLAGDIHARIGRILHEQQNWALAEESFAAALSIEPDAYERIAKQAECLLEIDRIDDAARKANVLIERFPERAEAWMLMARALLAGGHLEEADTAIRTVLRLDPLHADAYRLSGTLFEDAAQDSEDGTLYQKAEQMYARATRLDPSQSDLWLKIAEWNYLSASQADADGVLTPENRDRWLAKSRTAWENALRFLPASAVLQRTRAVQGILAVLDSKRAFEEIIATIPPYEREILRDPTALTIVGRAYVELDRAALAEQRLQRAVQLEPENARAHFYLGEAYRLRFDERAAQREYQLALTMGEFPEEDEAKRRVQTTRSRRRD